MTIQNTSQKNGPLSDTMLEERVTHLLQVTQSLTRLLKQENEWLKERRPSEIKGLAEEKTRLSGLYTRDLRIIRTHKSQLDRVDAALRRALKSATEEFNKTLEQNERLISRLRKVSEGLLQAIGEEIEKRNRPLTSYGRNASIGNKHRDPTTLALDARI